MEEAEKEDDNHNVGGAEDDDNDDDDGDDDTIFPYNIIAYRSNKKVLHLIHFNEVTLLVVSPGGLNVIKL